MNKAALALLCASLTVFDVSCAPIDDAVAESLASQSASQAEVVVFGEVHGTNEAPRALQLIVNAYVRLGYRVNLALEIPSEDVSRVTAKNLRNLESKFWIQGKDGRSSTSMLRVIRSLVASDSNQVTVSGFADVLKSVDQIDFFDELAAKRIAALCGPEDKGCRTLVLVGNAHLRIGGASSIPAKLESLGKKTYIVNFVNDGGSAWVCRRGECGTTPVTNPPTLGPCMRERLVLQDRSKTGVDAEYCFRSVSPSPPAGIWLRDNLEGAPAR